jgi:hypothetical protein
MPSKILSDLDLVETLVANMNLEDLLEEKVSYLFQTLVVS